MSERASLSRAVYKLDRRLLREAGEHLGTLGEQAREQIELMSVRTSRRLREPLYNRWATLSRLSREILELANGD